MRHIIYKNGMKVGTRQKLPKSGPERRALLRSQFGPGRFEVLSIDSKKKREVRKYKARKRK